MCTKKLLFCLILMALVISLISQVNGSLQVFGSKRVLHVWGSHHDRGYAHGYLLPTAITTVFNDYIFQSVTMSNPNFYNTLRNFYMSNFNLEDKYLQEATAIISGITDGGGNIYHNGLARNLDAYDLLFANAIVDISVYRNAVTGDDSLQLGCASLSSWGVSTVADTTLAGRLVVTRMLDWNQNSALIANPLVIVNHPSEPDEVKWISFTYPGLIGALSAISENGTSAFLNMGNVSSYNNLNGLHPILFSIRNAIESPDYNLDGISSPLDVFNAIAEWNHMAGTIIHAVSDNQDTVNGIIVENNNLLPAVYRTQNQNGNLPAGHLAATNHFRWLYNPVCCDRYVHIADSLFSDPEMSPKRQLSVMSGATGMSHNMMQIQYVPASGSIRWLTATTQQPAFSTSAFVLDANELFDFPVPVSDDYLPSPSGLLSIFPNPLNDGQDLDLKSDHPISDIALFNLRGQKVVHYTTTQPVVSFFIPASELHALARGIYLLRVRDSKGYTQTRKLMLVQ